MMASVYFAVGICSARALKNPTRHASFLWFVALSSVSHGLVMLFHALHDDAQINHLIGDVWILAGADSPLLHGRCGGQGARMMVIHNLGGELLASSNQGLEWLRETAKGLRRERGGGSLLSTSCTLYLFSTQQRPHQEQGTARESVGGT